jgi:DNA processing protein
LGCVVIEAAIASGSLITAQYALEAGREVLVVPGPINYPGSKGCHKLIKDGAHLVETAEEVAYVLGGTVNLAQKETRLSSHRMLANSDPDLNIVLSSICYDITPMDVIIKMCELPMSRIMSLLMELEAAGYITSVPGGYKKHMGVPNERNCA